MGEIYIMFGHDIYGDDAMFLVVGMFILMDICNEYGITHIDMLDMEVNR